MVGPTELAKFVGIPYQTLNGWVKLWDMPGVAKSPGRGNPRQFDLNSACVVTVVARLMKVTHQTVWVRQTLVDITTAIRTYLVDRPEATKFWLMVEYAEGEFEMHSWSEDEDQPAFDLAEPFILVALHKIVPEVKAFMDEKEGLAAAP